MSWSRPHIQIQVAASAFGKFRHDVTLGILGTGAFTLLVGYLLVLNGSFGSAGDSAADLDTSSAAVPGFGYVEDCITGSNRLVDADDCTVLSNFCFDLSSAAQGVTQGAVRPPLRPLGRSVLTDISRCVTSVFLVTRG